jgi:hypothetical protein
MSWTDHVVRRVKEMHANLKVRHHLEKLDVYEGIILKWF